MSTTSIDAGKLREWVDVLALRETGIRAWEWTVIRRVPAQITQTGRTNLFSRVGIGARDAALVLRRQPLSLHNALRWRGQHLFLTAITERGRLYMDASAALVGAVPCTAEARTHTVGAGNRPEDNEPTRWSFPAVLTERYVRYERDESYATAETGYVLVTPAPVDLPEGALITVGEGPAKGVYELRGRHVLDRYKNEYDLTRRGDV